MFQPPTFYLGALLLLAAFYLGRGCLVRSPVSLAMLLLVLVSLGLALSHGCVAAVALAPDNLPVLLLLGLLGGCTWWATRQAVENDRRLSGGRPPYRRAESARVFTWPDLVYSELIAMVVVMALLLTWAVLVSAPLEPPANPAITPNPAKAPWYFVGLQELLFYADGWMAGLTIPCLAVLGLLAIPYLDPNPAGNGYYTIRQRRFAYLTFQFGFWILFVAPIVVGTFFRGPNWTFSSPCEPQSAQEFALIRASRPSEWSATLFWLLYFLVLPPLLTTVMRDLYRGMGSLRFAILLAFLLALFALPAKMLFLWGLVGPT